MTNAHEPSGRADLNTAAPGAISRRRCIHATRSAWERWPDARTLVLVPLLVLCWGCPGLVPTDPGTDDPSVPTLDEPGNDSLGTATALSLDSEAELRFVGAIDSSSDIDVYSLGRLSPGTRIYADIQRLTGDLDPVAAIFDSNEHLVAFNDDRNADGSNLNPKIDIILPDEEDNYYLGVIAYPGNTTLGKYQAVVQVQRNAGTLEPRAQIVFLDWDGGDYIVVPNVGTYDLAAFSATDVGLPGAQTALLKDRVEQVVEERYDGYNLIVISSDDASEPSLAHSTVYFGGSDYRAFAISEQIDTFNQDASDKAIVFTRSYIGAFGHTPDFEEMAQALGNTVAHEVGHLLGLVHTRDCDSMMDTSCTNDRILDEQSFKTALIDGSVWPFGYQPATEILEWILGLVGM